MTKLVLQWQTAQAKTGNLKSTDVNPTLVRSQRGPKGLLIEQGRSPLWQSYLGGGPLV